MLINYILELFFYLPLNLIPQGTRCIVDIVTKFVVLYYIIFLLFDNKISNEKATFNTVSTIFAVNLKKNVFVFLKPAV